jgi:ABC-type multidrug transport system fused ATPase/permease subunit
MRSKNGLYVSVIAGDILTPFLQKPVEMDLNSVERVQEYLELEQEPPTIITNSRPSAAWPTEGCVSVNNLHIRYAPDLETVLRGVTFETKPKEKIGVVGRFVYNCGV